MPLPGGHQVDRARLDHLVRPDAVAMLDRAFEQIGHRSEVDVRVRPNVHALAGGQPRRAELVDEDEGPDHRPLARGQRPVDLERAKIVRDRRDDRIPGLNP